MKVINLFAGPGAGKSTLAAGIFYRLKLNGDKVELATEFAKDLTWEGRDVALADQPYIFGKQYHKLHRLEGKVKAVVTDSPILLSAFYAADRYPPSFKNFVLDMFNGMNNLNFYVKRTKPYSKAGRSQTHDEAKDIDKDVYRYLITRGIHFHEVTGDAVGLDRAMAIIHAEVG